VPTKAELKANHASTVAALQRAVVGGKLSAAEKDDAGDLLAAMAVVLAADGPANTSALYLLESATATERMRRGIAAAEAAKAA